MRQPERQVTEAPRAPPPRVVILTGVSGSGKTTALRAFEDAGFYCVDNLPIVFLEKLLELSGHTAGEVSRIALVVDAREGRFLSEAPRVIRELRQRAADVDGLFLDAPAGDPRSRERAAPCPTASPRSGAPWPT